MESWVPITVALIAAIVAIVGYLVTQTQMRRDRKAREFADALAALCNYVQLPYSIYLRRLAIPKIGPGDALAEAEAEAHSDVSKRMNEVWSHMHFSQIWLQVESQDVGKKYEELVTEARSDGPKSRQRAWNAELQDIESWAKSQPDFGVSLSMACRWRACIVEMRVALQPTWRFRCRQKLREKARNETFIPPFAPVKLRARTDAECRQLLALRRIAQDSRLQLIDAHHRGFDYIVERAGARVGILVASPTHLEDIVTDVTSAKAEVDTVLLITGTTPGAGVEEYLEREGCATMQWRSQEDDWNVEKALERLISAQASGT